MGQQVIRQPDGNYAIFSSISDGLVFWNADRNEVIEHFVEAAAQRAREDAERFLDKADEHGSSAPRQFRLTLKEAVDMHKQNFPEDADILPIVGEE